MSLIVCLDNLYRLINEILSLIRCYLYVDILFLSLRSIKKEKLAFFVVQSPKDKVHVFERQLRWINVLKLRYIYLVRTEEVR
jgi:hypothetical protein